MCTVILCAEYQLPWPCTRGWQELPCHTSSAWPHLSPPPQAWWQLGSLPPPPTHLGYLTFNLQPWGFHTAYCQVSGSQRWQPLKWLSMDLLGGLGLKACLGHPGLQVLVQQVLAARGYPPKCLLRQAGRKQMMTMMCDDSAVVLLWACCSWDYWKRWAACCDCFKLMTMYLFNHRHFKWQEETAGSLEWFFLYMRNIWMYVISCVCQASHMAVLCGKTLTLDVTQKLFNPLFHTLPNL